MAWTLTLCKKKSRDNGNGHAEQMGVSSSADNDRNTKKGWCTISLDTGAIKIHLLFTLVSSWVCTCNYEDKVVNLTMVSVLVKVETRTQPIYNHFLSAPEHCSLSHPAECLLPIHLYNVLFVCLFKLSRRTSYNECRALLWWRYINSKWSATLCRLNLSYNWILKFYEIH